MSKMEIYRKSFGKSIFWKARFGCVTEVRWILMQLPTKNALLRKKGVESAAETGLDIFLSNNPSIGQ